MKDLTIRSVKKSFRKDLIPTVGELVQTKRKLSLHELEMSQWIIEKFGGEVISLRARGGLKSTKTPDVLWVGFKLEIKRAKGKSSVDNSVNKGIQQVMWDGILLLDISENKKSFRQIKNEAIHRVERNLGTSKTSGQVSIYLLFVKNKKLLDVIEIRRKETKTRNKGFGWSPPC